jgi:hypothetical protein
MKSSILFRQFFVAGSSAVFQAANTTLTENADDVTRDRILTRMTRAPKILPWLARKAGIADDRAQAMWYEAVCYAKQKTGSVENLNYSRVVMERLRTLLEQEKVAALAVAS